MPACRRDHPRLPQYYAVLGRRAACRGWGGIARPLSAHRTGGRIRPAGGAGGDGSTSRTVLGIGGGTSRRARLVRRAGKAEDRHAVGGLWASPRRSCQSVDRGLLLAEMTALFPGVDMPYWCLDEFALGSLLGNTLGIVRTTTGDSRQTYASFLNSRQCLWRKKTATSPVLPFRLCAQKKHLAAIL